MKKFLLSLFTSVAFYIPAHAAGICQSGTLRTTFNPFTGKQDYVCVGGGGGGAATLPLPPGDTNYVRISTNGTVQSGGFAISSGTFSGAYSFISSTSTPTPVTIVNTDSGGDAALSFELPNSNGSLSNAAAIAAEFEDNTANSEKGRINFLIRDGPNWDFPLTLYRDRILLSGYIQNSLLEFGHGSVSNSILEFGGSVNVGTITWNNAGGYFQFLQPIQSSSATITGQIQVNSIRFPDGTVQVSSPAASSGGSGSAPGPGGSVQISSSGALSSVAGFVLSTGAANTLFTPGPIVSSGIASGMSTLGKGLTVNASGFATIDASFIALQSGGANALSFNPATNIFTSSVPIVGTTATFTGRIVLPIKPSGTPSLVLNGDATTGIGFPPSTSVEVDVSGIAIATFTATTLQVKSITWPDGTIQVSSPSASGGGVSGSSIYGATSTASFPFGFSASTGVFSSTITATRLVARDFVSISTSISMTPTGLPPWGLYVGGGSLSHPPVLFVDATLDGVSNAPIASIHTETAGLSLDSGGQSVATFGSGVGQGVRTSYPVTITSASGFYELGITTSSTGQYSLDVSTNGQVNSQGPAPVLSACGTNPTVTGSDTGFSVTPGSGSPSSCTATWSHARNTKPTCVMTVPTATSSSIVTYTTSSIAFTATITGILTTVPPFDVICIGHD